MKNEPSVRFLFDDGYAQGFVYRPPNVGDIHTPLVQHATLGVKFAQGVRFLDPWGFALIGKTRSQRIIFRIQHPLVYAKRGLFKLYRRIRRLFIKDRIVPCVQPKDSQQDEPR